MIIFIIIWSIWFISEVALNRLWRSGKTDKKDQDKGSIKIIWITIGIANSLGILFKIFVNFPISKSFILPHIGLLLIAVGMIIRFIAIWSLGRLFTVDLTIRTNHSIKEDGIYKLIRHPSYLGSLISFAGYGISLNNWLSLFVITISVTLAMLYRIRIEERLLMHEFGHEYSDYMKRTYRLIPFIY